MPSVTQRKLWRIATFFVAILIAIVTLTMAWLNPKLTRWIESDRFREMLENETAKGLHFSNGHYGPIRRTGIWTAESSEFQGTDGRKALAHLETRAITARFNPWGMLLRRWQLDNVVVATGEVGVQTYTPKPEATPVKPWFHIFLPERVYLKQVRSPKVDVTWLFREKESGFFGTELLILPHGRDFTYHARGGLAKMAPFPELRLEKTDLLITKTVLELYQLDLRSKNENGRIHAQGKAGTGEDRSVDFKFEIDHAPVNDWVPSGWHGHVAGAALARIHWTGKNPKLEDPGGDGTLRIDGGRVFGLPFLEKISSLTNEKELAQLALNVCKLDLQWRYPKIEIKNLVIEENGKFRAEGNALVNGESLRGTIELGISRRLLDWLPKPEEVFPREHDGYMWTTVHLSGTVAAPKLDLSERITEAIKEHPATALTLFLRQVGESLRQAFGGQ